MRARNLVIVLGAFAFVGGLAGCEGNQGPAGSNSLAETSDEPPGENCPEGGIKIEVGVDTSGNGALEPGEVTGTSYTCNGSGKDSLVRTSVEDAGANCPFGGTRIETGLDANNNGQLDDAEVNEAATSYVCTFGPNGTISPSEGIHIAVKANGVSTSATSAITVRFTLKDKRGYPLDINGAYSLNTPIQPRFSVGYFTKDANGIVSPLTVYTKSSRATAPNGLPTMFSPVTASTEGTLVENGLGAGDYTYTFPTTSVTPTGPMAVAYDPTKMGETHVVWISATRQTDLTYTANANTFSADNVPHYYVPNGASTPAKRELVAQEKCDNCHGKFKAETTASAQFHGGGRIAVGMCNVCHNPGRTTNLEADSVSFVHRIHNGHNVAEENLFHGIAATYPQDIKNCDTCHGGAEQGMQSQTNPSTLACKGCHDYVAFDNSAGQTCMINGQLVRGADGKPVPCNHVAGPQPEAACATCHGPTASFASTRYHKPVTPPDPNNAWLPGGTSQHTNASFIAAADFLPTGAHRITYDVKSVEAVVDGAVKRPQMTFKFKKNGTDVVFNTFAPTATPPVTELMDGFVGSPSAYFAFAVPQEGNPTPADFNASVSGYIKKIWDGTATGAGAGTMTGPDANGYYTIRLTGVQIPTGATLLTGGLGYTYALNSTPPLVQTDLAEYAWIPNTPPDGKAQGGLSVPAPNVWKVATGFTGRRPIVDNNKCNDCHGLLGVTPNFHAGQRNDGPTCSFCHTPNRASSGWSAGSKYFIHAIHAGRRRTVDFTWHAAAVGEGFNEVEFPGTLNTCTTCHFPNTYDYTATTNLNSIAKQPLTTVATGVYNSDPLLNSSYYTLSPYVTADGVTNYGAGFSYNAATNATTNPAMSTLVLSPITGACSACHDSPAAIDHMKGAGGQFYAPRTIAVGGAQEQCLLCHGPGRTAAIGEVHQR